MSALKARPSFRPEKEGAVHELRLGDEGAFKVTPQRGTSDPDKSIKVANPVYPFPVAEITVGRAEGRLQDRGKSPNLTAHGGEIGSFTRPAPRASPGERGAGRGSRAGL